MLTVGLESQQKHRNLHQFWLPPLSGIQLLGIGTWACDVPSYQISSSWTTKRMRWSFQKRTNVHNSQFPHLVLFDNWFDPILSNHCWRIVFGMFWGSRSRGIKEFLMWFELIWQKMPRTFGEILSNFSLMVKSYKELRKAILSHR